MPWPFNVALLLLVVGVTLLAVRRSLAGNLAATMLMVEESLTIARPPEVVFAFLADAHNDTVLSPRVVAVELTSPGPPRRGSTYRETVRVGSAIRAMECVVTDYDFPHHLGLRCQYEGRPLLGSYRVVPHDDGCTVIASSGTPHTVATAIFAPLVKAMIGRECRATLQRLRAALAAPN